MSIQLYKDGRDDAGASNQQALVVLPNGLQITEEEHEKRIKGVSPVQSAVLASCFFLEVIAMNNTSACLGRECFHSSKPYCRRKSWRKS